jgi:pimeloyl-ACP methyl ester carboxylesterase
MRAVFIHGACVRDGEWWWSRVAEHLAAEGVDSVAVRLPSCGEADIAPGTDGPGLAADVAEVRSVLSNLGPCVVVAHSYGGVVATEAADAGDVRHLVYVDSFLPDAGESLSDLGGDSPAPYLELAADGTFGVRAEMAEDLFLHDCDSDAVAGALARLTRQTTAVTTEPVHRAAWRTTPSTYVVCAGDRATSPAVQRTQAQRAHHVVELPSGHHPMLSHSELLARQVLTAARRHRVTPDRPGRE